MEGNTSEFNSSQMSDTSDQFDLQPPRAIDSKRQSVFLMTSHGSVGAAEIGEAVPIPVSQETRATYVKKAQATRKDDMDADQDDTDVETEKEADTTTETDDLQEKVPLGDRQADVLVQTVTADRVTEPAAPQGHTLSAQAEAAENLPAVDIAAAAGPATIHHEPSQPQTAQSRAPQPGLAPAVRAHSGPASETASEPGVLAFSESSSMAGSELSEDPVPLGRLNTIIRKPAPAPPAMSVSTGVDTTIPPRLRRRPVSEMLTRPDRTAPRHRLSLNLSQDLDKLMASATHLLSPEMGSDAFDRGTDAHAVRRGPSILSSTDTFLTAESSGPPVPAHAALKALPKRPSPDSMQRARQASQKWADGDLSDHGSQATVHPAPAREHHALADRHSRRQSAAAGKLEDGVRDVRGAPAGEAEARGAHAKLQAEAQSPASISPVGGSLEDGLGTDDGFYDVGEPVMVTGPAPAKSVKERIRPQRHRSKRRSKGAAKLRPFSYNTLINLLESINGTVVGEEFEQLNLPVKEKQLIEKIIDLLSRLTLDMVIDESRYDVGIGRLEKAHRALEGFL